MQSSIYSSLPRNTRSILCLALVAMQWCRPVCVPCVALGPHIHTPPLSPLAPPTMEDCFVYLSLIAALSALVRPHMVYTNQIASCMWMAHAAYTQTVHVAWMRNEAAASYRSRSWLTRSVLPCRLAPYTTRTFVHAQYMRGGK